MLDKGRPRKHSVCYSNIAFLYIYIIYLYVLSNVLSMSVNAARDPPVDVSDLLILNQWCPGTVPTTSTDEPVSADVLSLTRRRTPPSACKMCGKSPAFYPLFLVPGPEGSASEPRETTAARGTSTRRLTGPLSSPLAPAESPSEPQSWWSSPAPSWWRWGRRWPRRGGRS